MEINKAVEVFSSGGVVVFPTDTAVGIGCRMDKDEAVSRVYKIKQRDFKNPLLVLVDSIEMAKKYVQIPEEVEEKLINKHWPGGITIIFNCKEGMVSNLVNSNTNTLAVRLPDHQGILEVIRRVKVPIIATSANISGKKTPYKISEVDEGLKLQADFIMDGECTYKLQSTIVDTTVNPWNVIREGAVELKI